MKIRSTILSVFITFGFIVVVFRLVDIMIINHDRYLQKARFQQTRKEATPVKRGLILDRQGRELAVNLDTESIFCDPSEISSAENTSILLAKMISQRPDAIAAKLTTDGKFNWIDRKLDPENSRKIRGLRLRGIGFVPEIRRYYPKGSLASHIIGFVNIDNTGLEGVERKYDKYLSTRGENNSVFRDAKGNVLSDGQSREINGNNTVLTIDEGLQYILEKNLENAVQQWKAASATAIMMDPYSGEILAMANRPTFDLNNPMDAMDSQKRNRAITDCYEPGSTFKIIVGTAALEEGLVKPESIFDCSAGSIEVGGRRIRDAHKLGVLTFSEVIQKSSNVGSIKIGMNLGREKLYDYIKRFGFSAKSGVDLAGEVSGWVRPPNKWSGMSIGSISIGQEVAVTPLQVLRAYAVIANGGFLVKPYVVSAVVSPFDQVIYKAAPEAKRILSDKTADIFRQILRTVTEDGGTAKEAAIDGNQVAGKTGTAQLIDSKTKKYSKDRFVSSFVGFVPADKPRIAMIVVVHEPRGAIYGGVVAGPVFKQIANESLSYLSVPRDDYKEKGLLLVSNTGK